MKLKENTPLVLVISAYLCLVMALLPGRIEGAILKSAPAGGEEAVMGRAIARLERMGLSRGEAAARITALREAGEPLNGLFIRAGGEPPADYDPPINNVTLVFLICGGAAAIGAIIGYNASK